MEGQLQQEKGETVMEVLVTVLGLLPDIGILMLAKASPAFVQ